MIGKIIRRGSLGSWFSEFIMIALGVTLALGLENMALAFKAQKVERAYLESFSKDFAVNLKRLEFNIEANRALLSSVTGLAEDILSGQMSSDELPSRFHPLMNYDFFVPEDFTMTSIGESGEFRLLRDESIKQDLLKLRNHYEAIDDLQNNFQQALDDHIVPMMVENIDVIRGQTINDDFVDSHHLSNVVGYSVNDLQGRIQACERALAFLEEAQTRLDEHLSS